MRALLLTALLATAATAQDGPLTAPLFEADRCDAPATMPTPFEATAEAAAVEVALDGPAPVPMPNLCGDVAAGPQAGASPPVATDDGDRLPEVYRRQFPAPPGITPETLRRYRDLLERPPAPDAPRD